MPLIGVLGGLGPAATVDFLDQLVRLTPAARDQDHLPVLAAILPQVPDRNAAILGAGPDPLPYLLHGIDLLNLGGVDLVAIACNSAHHWYAQLSARSRAPVLHIGRACVARLRLPVGTRVLLLATRGAQHSGFYQTALRRAGLQPVEGVTLDLQDEVDACITHIKRGDRQAGGDCLGRALNRALSQGVSCAILACTELPLAARHCDTRGMTLADSTQALVHEVIARALDLAGGARA
jgi:aspartate racemase